MRPETSVIIPVRNGARFVAEAIASVLMQLGDGDEVLAIDDGSTDETPLILAKVVHPGLRLLSGGGRGVSAARNMGFAASRGEFIAFLDHDDIWPAGRHGTLTTALRQYEDLDAAFGRIARRFEPGALITPESRVERMRRVIGHRAGEPSRCSGRGVGRDREAGCNRAPVRRGGSVCQTVQFE